jgi:PAS domain S-box-containing protein
MDITNSNFRFIVENASEAIVIIDHEWRYTFVNYNAELLLRRKAAELIGQCHWQIFPELLNTPAEAALRRAMEKRSVVRYEQFLPKLYAWHSVRAVPSDGRIILYSQDITDRVRTVRNQAILAEVRSILENAPVAIRITRGKEHRIEMANARSRLLFPDRLIEGMSLRLALPELEDQGYFEILDQVFETGKPYEGREMFARYFDPNTGELTDGYFDVVYQPLFEIDGQVSGILSMATNVSQRVSDRHRLAEVMARYDALLASARDADRDRR